MLKFIVIFISFLILDNSFAKEPRICEYKDWLALYYNDPLYIKIYEKDPCIFIPKDNLYILKNIYQDKQDAYLKIILITSEGKEEDPQSPENIIYLSHSITKKEMKNVYDYFGHKFVIIGIAEMSMENQLFFDTFQNRMFVLRDVTDLQIELKK